MQRVSEHTTYNSEQLESIFKNQDQQSASVSPAPETKPGEDAPESYTRDDFLGEVYVELADLENMLGLLRRKKNLILLIPKSFFRLHYPVFSIPLSVTLPFS